MNKGPVFLGVYSKATPPGDDSAEAARRWHVWSLQAGQFLIQEIFPDKGTQGESQRIDSSDFFANYRVHAAFSAAPKVQSPQKPMTTAQKTAAAAPKAAAYGPVEKKKPEAPPAQAAPKKAAAAPAPPQAPAAARPTAVPRPSAPTPAPPSAPAATRPAAVPQPPAPAQPAAATRPSAPAAAPTRPAPAPPPPAPAPAARKKAAPAPPPPSRSIFDELEKDDGLSAGGGQAKMVFDEENYQPKDATFYTSKATRREAPKPLVTDLEKVEEQLRSDFSLALIRLQTNRDKALESLNKIADNNTRFEKKHKFMFSDFGTALRRRRLYALAFRFHERAKELSPDDEHILFNMARAMFDAGKIDQARKYLQQAVAMSKDFQAGSDFLEFIEGKYSHRL